MLADNSLSCTFSICQIKLQFYKQQQIYKLVNKADARYLVLYHIGLSVSNNWILYAEELLYLIMIMHADSNEKQKFQYITNIYKNISKTQDRSIKQIKNQQSYNCEQVLHFYLKMRQKGILMKRSCPYNLDQREWKMYKTVLEYNNDNPIHLVRLYLCHESIIECLFQKYDEKQLYTKRKSVQSIDKLQQQNKSQMIQKQKQIKKQEVVKREKIQTSSNKLIQQNLLNSMPQTNNRKKCCIYGHNDFIFFTVTNNN